MRIGCQRGNEDWLSEGATGIAARRWSWGRMWIGAQVMQGHHHEQEEEDQGTEENDRRGPDRQASRIRTWWAGASVAQANEVTKAVVHGVRNADSVVKEVIHDWDSASALRSEPGVIACACGNLWLEEFWRVCV